MSFTDSLRAAVSTAGDALHHVVRDVQAAAFQPHQLSFDAAVQTGDPTAHVDPGATTGGGPGAPATPKADAGSIRSARLDLPGTPDMDLARANAQRVLDGIDWTKPDIALWVPATGSHSAPAAWQSGPKGAFDDARTSTATVDYPASENFNDSVSTGVETMRLVMAGIAEHGDGHRVLVGSHSQGAWVVGEAMASPEVASRVDRAVLFGHPGTAAHQYGDRHDPKVVEVDDPSDPFTWPVEGRDGALEGVERLQAGDAGGVLEVAGAAVQNPLLATYLLGRTAFKEDFRGEADPHHYENLYGDAARWLAAAPAAS
jgi:hypothetical protein